MQYLWSFEKKEKIKMEKVQESWSERTLRWKVPADARFKAIYIKLKKAFCRYRIPECSCVEEAVDIASL